MTAFPIPMILSILAFPKATLMHCCDDTEMLRALPDYLKGFTKSAYNNLITGVIDTAATALKAFARACALSKTTHLANFLKRRPNPRETMVSFASSL